MSSITAWPCLNFFREHKERCDKWVDKPSHFCRTCNPERQLDLARLELWIGAQMEHLQVIVAQLQAPDLDQKKVAQMVEGSDKKLAPVKLRKALEMYSMEGDSTYERIYQTVEAVIAELEEKEMGIAPQRDGNTWGDGF